VLEQDYRKFAVRTLGKIRSLLGLRREVSR